MPCCFAFSASPFSHASFLGLMNSKWCFLIRWQFCMVTCSLVFTFSQWFAKGVLATCHSIFAASSCGCVKLFPPSLSVTQLNWGHDRCFAPEEIPFPFTDLLNLNILSQLWAQRTVLPISSRGDYLEFKQDAHCILPWVRAFGFTRARSSSTNLLVRLSSTSLLECPFRVIVSIHHDCFLVLFISCVFFFNLNLSYCPHPKWNKMKFGGKLSW